MLNVMEYPVSAIGIRKVQNTILKSSYANFKGAANVLGVRHLFDLLTQNLRSPISPGE